MMFHALEEYPYDLRFLVAGFVDPDAVRLAQLGRDIFMGRAQLHWQSAYDFANSANGSSLEAACGS